MPAPTQDTTSTFSGYLSELSGVREPQSPASTYSGYLSELSGVREPQSTTATFHGYLAEFSLTPAPSVEEINITCVKGDAVSESFTFTHGLDLDITVARVGSLPTGVTDDGSPVAFTAPYPDTYNIGGIADVAPGSYSWSYTLTDTDSNVSTVTVNLTVTNQDETIAASPAGPFNITVGSSYSPLTTITCGDPDGGNNTLSLVSGSLPAGLSFSQALPYTAAVDFSVTISGTPDPGSEGDYALVLRNTDSIGAAAEITINIKVVAPDDVPFYVDGPLLGVVQASRGRYGVS